MKEYIVRLLPACLLLLSGALGCRPGSPPGGESSADRPTVERNEADSQPKSPPGVEAGVIEAGGESAAASAELLGREYVPPDALFVSAVFPHRTLARPELADASIERVLQKIGHLDRPLEMPVPTRFLMELGIPLEHVEQVMCVVTGIRTARATPQNVSKLDGAEEPREINVEPDGESVMTGDAEFEEATPEKELEERTAEETKLLESHTTFEQDPWLYGPLMEAYVVRLTGAVPREAAVDLLFRSEAVTLDGKTYFGQDRDTGALAVHFADERTMIVGEERVVRRMLGKKKGLSALTEALGDLDLEADIVGVLNLAAVSEQVIPRTETDPASEALADDASVATFSVRLDPRPSANVVVHVKNAAAGDRVKEMFRSGIAAAREQLAGMPSMYPQQQVQEFRELARDLFARGVNALKFDRVEDRVEITLGNFAPLSDLSDLLSRFGTAALGRIDVPLPAVPLLEEDVTGATIRRLLPAAAGSRAEILCTIACSPTAPKPSELLVDPALSAIVMMYKIHPPGLYEAHAEEFGFNMQEGGPKPSEMARELFRSKYLGYYSMIHANRITGFTCEVDGETAKGCASFKVPGLWEGKVQYAAERVDGRWRITELQMPIHRWRFVRTEAGRWKWLTLFGDAEDLSRQFGRVSGEPISGKITLDGKPLREGSIEFFHTVDVSFMEIGHIRDGTCRVELPLGSYYVAIHRSDPEVPKQYRRPDESGLMIDVKEGANTFDLDLASE